MPLDRRLVGFALVLVSLLGIAPAFGAERCEDLYFGIGQPPDLSRALQCFEARKGRPAQAGPSQDWPLLILMHLNGEGAPADVQQAEDLLQAWQRTAPEQRDNLEAKALREAIDQRKAHPGKTFPRLDYCKDVARDTLAIDFCGDIQEGIAEARLGKTTTRLRALLKPADAEIFDRVVAAFKAFQEADARRGFQRYAGGTARITAAMGQSAFVREQFLALLRTTVEQHALQPADEAAYRAADRELDRAYREAIAAYAKDDGDPAGGGRAAVDLYAKDVQEAQRRWIAYRDLWARLAQSLYGEGLGKVEPALSMKTAVTRSRMLELRHDPLQTAK